MSLYIYILLVVIIVLVVALLVTNTSNTPPGETAVDGPTYFKCESGVCMPSDVSTAYTDMASCTANCKVNKIVPVGYSCSAGQCFETTDGLYTSLSECNANCANLSFMYGGYRYGRRGRRRRWSHRHSS